jgi:hypothetical protein
MCSLSESYLTSTTSVRQEALYFQLGYEKTRSLETSQEHGGDWFKKKLTNLNPYPPAFRRTMDFVFPHKIRSDSQRNLRQKKYVSVMKGLQKSAESVQLAHFSTKRKIYS